MLSLCSLARIEFVMQFEIRTIINRINAQI